MADKTATDPVKSEARKQVWMRGLWMLVLALLFGVAEFLLFVSAVLQFLWLLFTGAKNEGIAEFGAKLSNWLAITARFQTCASDEMPFPWTEWK